ncbi:transporter substrate-binding domain-containing protein [Desulfurispira natronophila]|uniref:histidine kinase n=1 Tax=Desulfurispira natronophila TaxID=682562 RepID=A0A7W8DGP8_9BACT|nr:transporter substrate-binding domain-containing protein [Desulfurispira natronophila]MBB5021483.1 polar amino acid transport system substrate-binding protein [Desulfurispira natronophila]
MTASTKLIFVCIFLWVLPGLPAQAWELNNQEQEYVRQHPVVTVGVIDGNEPFSFHLDGEVVGISIDMLERISQQTGLQFRYRMGRWTDLLDSFRQGELDVIDGISHTREREAYTLFTTPYNVRQTDLFVRADSPLASKDGMDWLSDYRIAIVRDIYYQHQLEEAGIQLMEYDGLEDVMKAPAFGWVDGAVMAPLTGQYIIRRHNLPGLVSIGSLESIGIAPEDFRLGVNPGRPMLHRILQKSLDALAEEELDHIRSVWLQRGEWQSWGGQVDLPSHLQAFVEQKRSARVGVLEDFSPFSFWHNHKLSGFTVDLLDKLSRKSGMEFELLTGNWSELLNDFREGRLDVIANISHTSEREPFTRFTDSYYDIPVTVFIRNDFPQYTSLASVDTGSIGVVQDVYFEQELRQFSSARIDTFADHEALARALSFGLIDAAVMNLAIGNHMVKKLGLTNVQIAEEFALDSAVTEDLRFGVNPALEPLQEILNLGLRSIAPEEWIQMENRWLGAKVHSPDALVPVFSQEEIHYLDSKGPIRVCVDPDWMPYEQLDNQGNHQGIAADFLQLMARKGQLDLQIVPTSTWQESIVKAKQRECDILSLAMKTPDRLEYMDFTTPYLSTANVLVTNISHPFINSISDVLDETFAIVEGYAYEEILRRKYPTMQLVSVPNEMDGLRQVQSGQVFGYFGSMASVGYTMQQHGIFDVKITHTLDVDWELGVATRNDEPLLREIFQKLVDNISEAESREILAHWVAVRYEQGSDYRLLLQVLAAISVVVLAIVAWNYKLASLNRQLAVRVEEEVSRRLLAEEEHRNHERVLLQRSKMADMGEMIGAITHQWKQPLNIISLNLSALEMETENLPQEVQVHLRYYTGSILQQVDFMAQTVDDFSHFFTPSKKKQPFNVKAFYELYRIISPYFEKVGIEVKVVEKANFYVVGYANEFKQVALNLLVNAKDAIEERQVAPGRITVEFDCDHQWGIMRFSDNGGGIPDHLLPDQLFQSYTTTKGKKGTGIGLQLARTIIETNMQGTIEATNSAEGAVLTIRLPLYQERL